MHIYGTELIPFRETYQDAFMRRRPFLSLLGQTVALRSRNKNYLIL